ncbi:hypothetical protein [Pseudanabaena sp. ABRG5-3]|uniref:hypothetical protein n=1 Tax=Pseudanabaena sp. ABRG5-3 TaxID=685565 RepID=UPI000DC6FAE1|nr:hypothetical protein [Pseudanabaena sp. ABRG5-3]BBC24781.1 hypothetical protein ABRG53_2524 [Pseudanabaena sp. ABRG5-3]
MTPEQFLETVAQMRKLQKEYFATRDKGILDRCKFAERLVDLHIQKAQNPQIELFQ